MQLPTPATWVLGWQRWTFRTAEFGEAISAHTATHAGELHARHTVRTRGQAQVLDCDLVSDTALERSSGPFGALSLTPARRRHTKPESKCSPSRCKDWPPSSLRVPAAPPA